MAYVEFECGDCGHIEERELHRILGEFPGDDDFEVEGGEVENCSACGSDDIMDHTVGGPRGRDEGREDFHSDG